MSDHSSRRHHAPCKRAWTRREVLGALAAVSLPASRAGATARRRVGIVGGGMAGVSLAWLLDGACDVVLLEARDVVGGNVQSVEVEVDGRPVVIDVGAQYFHPGPYPTYVALLSQLGLFPPDLGECHSFPASITFWKPPRVVPDFVSPILPGRLWPLLAGWNRAGLSAFTTAFRAAKERDDADESWSLTLGDWLPSLGLSRRQWEGMILPWAASLYSGDVEETRGLSARAAMVFVARALPDQLTRNLDYYVLDRGMAVPLQRMLDGLGTTEVLTGARVSHVARKLPHGFVIHCADGRSRQVDDLVLASSGPASRRLLQSIPGTGAQRAALAGIGFRDARLVLHTDPAFAPAGPLRSFLNCAARGGYCEASMWMAPVLGGPDSPGPSVWKSWITHRREPRQVLHEALFRHMLPTPASLGAQVALRALQGQGGVWFAGGYTWPFDSQETALLSAIQVAGGLGASSSRSRILLAAESNTPM